jgi:hypothetical protein
VTAGDGSWTCGDIAATTTGAPTVSGNGNNKTTTLTLSGATTGMFVGMSISGTNVPSGSLINAVNDSLRQIQFSGDGTSISSGTSLTLTGYWNTAHPTGTSGNGHAPSGCASPATISRASVYAAENANNYQYAQDASGGNEQGNGNFCSAAQTSGRRTLHVAVVNCQAELGNLNGHTNVPIAAYVKVFLTLPIDGSTITAPYVEMTGLDTPGDGFLYQNVQLYR